MKTRKLLFIFLAVIFIAGLVAVGCSSKSDLLKEVSGQWQDDQGKKTVEIRLNSDTKELSIDGHAYPVSVEKVQMDRYQVNLKVQNGSGEPELWTLRQVWNDNGSGFKLAFDHSGASDLLIPKGQS